MSFKFFLAPGIETLNCGDRRAVQAAGGCLPFEESIRMTEWLNRLTLSALAVGLFLAVLALGGFLH